MPEEWETLTIKPMIKGYNSALVPSALPEGASPKIENFSFKRGRIETDTGLTTFGETVIGTPRLLYLFWQANSQTQYILITSSRFYRWTSGPDRFQLIRDGDVQTQADGGEPAEETAIVVDDITGFIDSYPISIALDDGTYHETTIDGTPAGVTITIDDAIPVGRSVPDNAQIWQSIAIVSTSGRLPSIVHYPPEDSIIINAPLASLYIYDGVSLTKLTDLETAVGGTCYAQTIAVKDNKLILFNTRENGVQFSQRVRWSATGDYKDWTTVNDAGFEDVFGSEDIIRAAEHLGPYIIIYRDRTIWRMEYVGTSDLIYNFEKMISGKGTVGSNSVLISEEQDHIVFDRNSMYRYSGGYTIEPFGEEVWESIYGELADLEQLYLSHTFAVNLTSIRKYFFIIIQDGDTEPVMAWVYDAKLRAWTTRVFQDVVTCIAEFNEDTATTTFFGFEDTAIFVGGEQDGDGQVFTYYGTLEDIYIIPAEFQTGEIYYPGYKVRVNRVRIVGKGIIVITYSTDEGSTWTAYGTATCGADYSRQDVFKQLTEDRIMFKFRSWISGPGTGSEEVGIDMIQIYWKQETEF